MVKIATSVFFAAVLVGPVIAGPILASSVEQYQREVESDEVLAREVLETIFGREFDLNEIDERDPFGLGLALKLGRKVAGKLIHHHHHNDNNKREIEDLEEFFARELSDIDLEERDPFGLGLLFKAATKGVKALTKIGKHHHHASGGNNNNNHKRELEDLEEFFARELSEIDDLEERDPFGLGLLFKAATKGVKALTKIGKHHHHASGGNNNNNHKRELDMDDLLEREFEDGMLDELD